MKVFHLDYMDWPSCQSKARNRTLLPRHAYREHEGAFGLRANQMPFEAWDLDESSLTVGTYYPQSADNSHVKSLAIYKLFEVLYVNSENLGRSHQMVVKKFSFREPRKGGSTHEIRTETA